jgi:hypothetical protein
MSGAVHHEKLGSTLAACAGAGHDKAMRGVLSVPPIIGNQGMAMRKFGVGLVLALLVSAGSAAAQQTTTTAPAAAAPAAAPAAPEVKRVKMRTLLAAGYEIKAVAIVSQEITSRIAQKPDKDAALVTLQKNGAAATCLLDLVGYVSPGMIDIEWCIEQK